MSASAIQKHHVTLALAVSVTVVAVVATAVSVVAFGVFFAPGAFAFAAFIGSSALLVGSVSAGGAAVSWALAIFLYVQACRFRQVENIRQSTRTSLPSPVQKPTAATVSSQTTTSVHLAEESSQLNPQPSPVQTPTPSPVVSAPSLPKPPPNTPPPPLPAPVPPAPVYQEGLRVQKNQDARKNVLQQECQNELTKAAMFIGEDVDKQLLHEINLVTHESTTKAAFFNNLKKALQDAAKAKLNEYSTDFDQDTLNKCSSRIHLLTHDARLLQLFIQDLSQLKSTQEAHRSQCKQALDNLKNRLSPRDFEGFEAQISEVTHEDTSKDQFLEVIHKAADQYEQHIKDAWAELNKYITSFTQNEIEAICAWVKENIAYEEVTLTICYGFIRETAKAAHQKFAQESLDLYKSFFNGATFKAFEDQINLIDHDVKKRDAFLNSLRSAYTDTARLQSECSEELVKFKEIFSRPVMNALYQRLREEVTHDPQSKEAFFNVIKENAQKENRFQAEYAYAECKRLMPKERYLPLEGKLDEVTWEADSLNRVMNTLSEAYKSWRSEFSDVLLSTNKCREKIENSQKELLQELKSIQKSIGLIGFLILPNDSEEEVRRKLRDFSSKTSKEVIQHLKSNFANQDEYLNKSIQLIDSEQWQDSFNVVAHLWINGESQFSTFNEAKAHTYAFAYPDEVWAHYKNAYKIVSDHFELQEKFKQLGDQKNNIKALKQQYDTISKEIEGKPRELEKLPWHPPVLDFKVIEISPKSLPLAVVPALPAPSASTTLDKVSSLASVEKATPIEIISAVIVKVASSTLELEPDEDEYTGSISSTPLSIPPSITAPPVPLALFDTEVVVVHVDSNGRELEKRKDTDEDVEATAAVVSIVASVEFEDIGKDEKEDSKPKKVEKERVSPVVISKPKLPPEIIVGGMNNTEKQQFETKVRGWLEEYFHKDVAKTLVPPLTSPYVEGFVFQHLQSSDPFIGLLKSFLPLLLPILKPFLSDSQFSLFDKKNRAGSIQKIVSSLDALLKAKDESGDSIRDSFKKAGYAVEQIISQIPDEWQKKVKNLSSPEPYTGASVVASGALVALKAFGKGLLSRDFAKDDMMKPFIPVISDLIDRVYDLLTGETLRKALVLLFSIKEMGDKDFSSDTKTAFFSAISEFLASLFNDIDKKRKESTRIQNLVSIAVDLINDNIKDLENALSKHNSRPLAELVSKIWRAVLKDKLGIKLTEVEVQEY